ncbi:MAG TPA: hypothetical protein PKI20_16930 [Verrucomicrobiota bacterium]|jgi:hypothetical protein|nr:hypothetical protein [Verrucomicrobiota bacterium]HQL79460.1 hypothetical protein [Verrucomicrobiota bacterium]
MIRRLDKVWFGLLGKTHRWILCQVAAHYRREMVRGAEAHRRLEAVRRLERHVASQNPNLN